MNLEITRRLLRLEQARVAIESGIPESSLEKIESTPSHILFPNHEVRALCSYYSNILGISTEKLIVMLAQGNNEGLKVDICKNVNRVFRFIGGIFLDGTKKEVRNKSIPPL
jgi:hypothetical protein